MNDFIQALEQLQAEKGIDKEVIFKAIEDSLVTACKKNFGTSQNITVNMDRTKGTVEVLAWKNVVEEVTDPALDIAVERCYRPEPFTSDEERLEHLFKLYEKMTK